MKNARTPLAALAGFAAALALPLAFAQSETQPAPPAAPETQQMTWADIDTDGNGTVSKLESAQVASLAQVFDQADANADGELSQEEYNAYVARAGEEPVDDNEG